MSADRRKPASGSRSSEPEDSAQRPRRLTMFVQPRTRIEPLAGGKRVLYVGGSPDGYAAVTQMLTALVDPPYEVDEAPADCPVVEALANATYDAVVVEVSGKAAVWRRFVQERRVPELPVIVVDHEGEAEQRSARRALFVKEGASAYIRLAELSGPLLDGHIYAGQERVQLRHALSEVQERFALAVRGANDGAWEWILGSDEMHFSRRWRELLGYGVDDLANTASEWFDRVHEEDLEALRADINAHLVGEKPYHENEHRIRASDGTYRWVISRAVAQRQNGRPVRMAGSLSDTSDFRLREEKLREESRQDPLTGLPRREPFLEQVGRAVAAALKDPEYTFTVLMVDVDRFRWLADSVGHQAADGMLSILARRLVACVRPGDVVARFGGDKFAVLLDNLEEVRLATDIANRIRLSVHEPFEIDGQTVYTTVSIGLTSSSRGYEDVDEVISDVAAAANKAKERGQDRHEVFDTKMRIDALTTLRLEVALRQAVERREFELHYQPIVDLKTGNLVGFEALTRWRHPRRGIVSPGEFIPVAEQTGLIVPIGRWAIHEALEQLGRWQVTVPRLANLSMSVNLSGRQIADPRLLEEMELALKVNNIDPSRFRLELTESVLMENAETVQRILHSLKASGVRIWIDDFGTGYSSLSYLHRFPVDGLKIDKSFVDGLDGSGSGVAMVKTIMSLAQNLGVEVIAEGIEQSVQADRLLALGCVRGQGYLFGRPIAASGIVDLLDPEGGSDVPQPRGPVLSS